MDGSTVDNGRRRMMTDCISVTGAAVFLGIVSGCEKDSVKSADKSYEFDVATEEVLAVEGGAVRKTLGEINSGSPVVIIRSGVKTFTVLSGACTHQGCQLNLPTAPGGDLVCPCHASRFSSTDGSVKTGPASDSLLRFVTSFDSSKNILTIRY